MNEPKDIVFYKFPLFSRLSQLNLVNQQLKTTPQEMHIIELERELIHYSSVDDIGNISNNCLTPMKEDISNAFSKRNSLQVPSENDSSFEH